MADVRRPMTPGKLYERIGDMSPDDKLVLLRQRDGDMQVAVKEWDSKGNMRMSTVEFCLSGGRSRHTREALYGLAMAIEKDNEERPIE